MSEAALLRPHRLSVALVRPQIPQNTGNIARTCVATGTELHLAGPMGFVLDDRRLRRAGLDYWPRLKLQTHPSEEALMQNAPPGRVWLFDSSGTVSLFDAPFENGDRLVFGSETRGISPETMAAHRERVVRIPQVRGERCLNLATSVGIALYTALQRIERRLTSRDDGANDRTGPAGHP